MYEWRMVGWRGMFFFFLVDPCRNPMGTLFCVGGWQRLTMGSQREMMNGVFVSFFFSDQELTVVLPSSGKESNPQDLVKRFPRL